MPKHSGFGSFHIPPQGIKLISVDKKHGKKSGASGPEHEERYMSPDDPYNNRLFKIHTVKCLKVFTSTKCGYGEKKKKETFFEKRKYG